MPPLVVVPVSPDTRIVLKDDASSQPACNRAALVAITTRRRQDRRDVATAMSEAWEAEEACMVREHEANERVNAAEWWAQHGWKVGVGATLAVEAVIVAVTALIYSVTRR